jgi:hypothetical protein
MLPSGPPQAWPSAQLQPLFLFPVLWLVHSQVGPSMAGSTLLRGLSSAPSALLELLEEAHPPPSPAPG